MNRVRRTLPELTILNSLAKEMQILAEYVRRRATPGCTLQILEAGCGKSWELDLDGVAYELTGVDLDEPGLRLRQTEKRDLDRAIVGDLRTVSLEEGRFDVIYNSFVLEHIDGGERVLDNFLCWLKPGGILILRIPDRHSVYGFLTRVTPFWFHVVYKRYVEGHKDAGRPGHGPFPTVHEPIVSRAGIRDWCARHGLTIAAEYGSSDFFNAIGRFAIPARILLKAIHVASLGSLAPDYSNLTYVIKKPAAAVNDDSPSLQAACEVAG